MDNAHMCSNRRGLFGRVSTAKPLSREEKDFANAFGNALSHATSAIAAEPMMSVSEGSIAHHVRKAYLRFRPEKQPAIQKRARALFSRSSEQRQRYFGAYTDSDPKVWSNAEAGLDLKMREQLRQAVHGRLEAQREQIAENLAIGVAIESFNRSPGLSKTKLETGYFHGEMIAAFTDITINSPISIDLRWETNEADAEEGIWQLYRAGQTSQSNVLLAVGNAGKAPGGIFAINLGNYLPPNPPNVPTKYLIRVTPKTAMQMNVQGPTTSSTKKAPGKAVGLPSNDVRIEYTAFVSPPTQFNVIDYYGTLQFNLDSIKMIQDQFGPGVEEFHISGFVQEMVTNSPQSAQQKFFGPYSVDIDPNGDRTIGLGGWDQFGLPVSNAPEWPRAYIGVFSIIEEDDGGSLSAWQSQVAVIAEMLIGSEIKQDIMDYLEEQFKDYIDNIDVLIQTGGAIANWISAMIASQVLGIIGVIIAVATGVIAAIISGMGDEYYGTETFVFVLPTNITEYVNKLPGHQPSDEIFQLDGESLSFSAESSWSATGYDGAVELRFYWKFGDKIKWMGEPF